MTHQAVPSPGEMPDPAEQAIDWQALGGIEHGYRNTGANVSRSKRARVYSRDGHACVHCGSGSDLTIDHIAPQVHGGRGGTDNLQTLCRSCNSRKGAR